MKLICLLLPHQNMSFNWSAASISPEIGKAAFSDEFGDVLRFLSNYFICIKVQNNVVILFLFCFDVLGQINDKLLPWVG